MHIFPFLAGTSPFPLTMTSVPDIGIARITCTDRTQELDWQILIRAMGGNNKLKYSSYSIRPSGDVWVQRSLTPASQTATNSASVFLHIASVDAGLVDGIKADMESAGAMPPSFEDSPRDLASKLLIDKDDELVQYL